MGTHEQECAAAFEAIAQLLDLFGSDFSKGYRAAWEERGRSVELFEPLDQVIAEAVLSMPKNDSGIAPNAGLQRYVGPAGMIRPEIRSAIGEPVHGKPQWFYESNSGSTRLLIGRYQTGHYWVVLDLEGSSFLWGYRNNPQYPHRLDTIAAIAPDRRIGGLPDKQFYPEREAA